MKIALCQINPIPGNIAYNVALIQEEIRRAAALGSTLAIFPELAIPGYPPRDLLDYPDFLQSVYDAMPALQETCRAENITAFVGTIQPNGFPGKKALLNSCATIHPDGHVDYTYKKLLPTYDVFDEDRYFAACPAQELPPIAGITSPDGTSLRVGCAICEDIWNDNEFYKDQRLYPVDPIQILVNCGIDIIINISASPFVEHKPGHRMDMLRHVAKRWDKPIILVNQVGGCDQVIFDGGSCVVLPDGTVPQAAGWLRENTVIWDSTSTTESPDFCAELAAATDETGSIVDALTLGLRDYLAKTGFQQVIVGNSGGIDSAVTLALAVHALGAENVISVTMPGRYSSGETRDDADELAEKLKIRHMKIPIEPAHQSYSSMLRNPDAPLVQTMFYGDASTMNRLADENIQARIRGNILMYVSNAIVSPRTLVLSTGNKSELAVGYCTLYGDMCGGLALISDLPKTTVYRVARYLNDNMAEAIPQSIIDREPSAELAAGQKDSDSLPPYPVLDNIIRQYVEDHKGLAEIVASGVADEPTVSRVIRLITNAEYKRAQAAPGLKVTSKAFGVGRRIPIARGTT